MDTTKKRSRIRLAAIVAAAVAVVAGLTGVAVNAGEPPVSGHQAVAQLESARSEFQASRSFSRDETPCPVLECEIARKALALTPAPTPTPSVTPKKQPVKKPSTRVGRHNCDPKVHISNSIWQGPCPPKPSMATLMRIAHQVLATRRWDNKTQFGCLYQLVAHESGWNPYDENSIHAYGLPQAYKGSKMRSAGSDWGYNPRTQLMWMMGYIAGVQRYKTPCGAWSMWNQQWDKNHHHWY